MWTKSVNRSGMLLIIAGILIAGPMLFHPDDSRPDFAFPVVWVPVHVLMGIGALSCLAGLAGLYWTLQGKVTVFGSITFALAILGTILFVGLLFFVEATLLPDLGRDPAYQSLLRDNGPLMGGSFGFAVIASLTLVSLSYLLLAIYLIASRIISVANGLLFIGAPLAAFAPPLPYAVGIFGGVLFGVALIWLGVSIRRGTAHKALEVEMRFEDECLLLHAGGHA